MNIKDIFLQGALEEEVYMTISPSHRKEMDSNLAFRLKKVNLRAKAISTGMI
jgi:hypothetical protein